MHLSTAIIALLAATSTAQTLDVSPEKREPGLLSGLVSTATNIVSGTVNAVGNTVNSILNPGNGATPASCPAVWNNISTTLTGVFLADGQCTDAARAAIRAAFHDWYVPRPHIPSIMS